MSFIEKITKSRKHLLRFVTGKNNGLDAWWYILVKPDKFEKYKTQAKTNSMNLAEYSEILYYGWGKKPPEKVKKKIEEEFN